MNFLLIIFAFICEFVDSSLGMGYGTTLTSILILLGYDAIQIVPCILVSELCTGIWAAYLHHRYKNVDLSFTSRDFKTAIFIGGLSLIGCAFAVVTAVSVPKQVLNMIISVIVLSMGVIMIVTRNKIIKFSWGKVGAIGLLASFNKGLSGGGYGPLVMGGQVFSGIKTKNAIGITSFAESITCFFGIVFFLIAGNIIDFDIWIYLVTGSMMSVPISVFVVKKLPEKKLKIFVAIFILLIGIFSVLKIII